ncbi:MAG: hypothetical protein ACTS22_08035 [Phycisphaerales bacterium]
MNACPRCRYDRTSLAHDQPCPECGTNPALALDESRLVNADPRRRRRVRAGAFLALLCIPARVISLGIAAAVWIATPGQGLTALAVAAAAVGIPVAAAWWMLTTPDRRHDRLLPDRAARLGLRALAAMQLVACALVPLAVINADPLVTAYLEISVLGTIWPGLAVLGVVYTRELARQADAPRVADTANALLKYTAIASLSLALGVIGAALTALIPILFVATVPLAVPYLIFLGLLLLFALAAGARLHLMLARAVADAGRLGA